jgi:hypothetical protein
MAKRAPKRRSKASKGRPRGIRFSEEQRQLILGAIERGATPHAAAQAAGIKARTFRELHQRAEGRHPTRGPLPELAAFFRQVDEATARARIKREIEIAESDPKHWLKHQARSRPGLDGWTEPVPEANEVPALHVATIEEIEGAVGELLAAGVISAPHCSDPSCPCPHHRSGRSDDVE